MTLNTEQEFIEIFPSPEISKSYILNNIFYGNKPCPYCGCTKTYKLGFEETHPLGRFKCANSDCYKRFGILTKTVFHAMNIPLNQGLFLLWVYATKNVSTYDVRALSGFTQKTTWFRKAKFGELINNHQKGTNFTLEMFNDILKKAFLPNMTTFKTNLPKTKEITTSQYAQYLGCTAQNISKHIRQTGTKFLPDVMQINYYSRFVLLVVREDLEVPKHKKIILKAKKVLAI